MVRSLSQWRHRLMLLAARLEVIVRRQVNIVFRSLFILVRAGSKDLCRHLSLILFKKRQVFPFGKWREGRERKRRLTGRARVISSSSQRALAKQLRFSPGLERRSLTNSER